MADRYFVDEPIEGDHVLLAGSEAHHLARVMRASVGDEVTLFDGHGAEFSACVVRVAREQVELEVTNRVELDRELPLRLVLAVALPKGDRQRWLVEKCVELGVTKIVPLRTTRGVAAPVDAALARLRRAVVEASKQCGRNRLMEIGAPQAWCDYASGIVTESARFVADPSATASLAGVWASLLAGRSTAPDEVRFAVGPEGGFTSEEIEHAAAAGWQTVGLGARTLRVETACLALAAWVAGAASC